VPQHIGYDTNGVRDEEKCEMNQLKLTKGMHGTKRFKSIRQKIREIKVTDSALEDILKIESFDRSKERKILELKKKNLSRVNLK
jgi:hypothetical protein